jgi:hypothetical protein
MQKDSAVAPDPSKYLLAAQSVHGDPLTEYLPKIQVPQFKILVAAVTDPVPALQLRHVEAPVPTEYFPAGHCVHCAKFCVTRSAC